MYATCFAGHSFGWLSTASYIRGC